MPVSIDTTSTKYHGSMSANYETKRKTQERWDIENATVEKMLRKLKPKSILDVPCGTGRFFNVYNSLGEVNVIAVDVSSSMLEQAQKKADKCKTATLTLKCKDVRVLKTPQIDVSVCVRFLDLIDEAAMRGVMKKLYACTDTAIICTIRLGDSYIPKSNTATHDQAKFRSQMKKVGWKIAEEVPVFKQGWFILRLGKR